MSPMLFWSSLIGVLLLGAALAAALLTDAGYVWMIWQGVEVQTSVAFLLLAFVLLWLAVLLVWFCLTSLWKWSAGRQNAQPSIQRQAQPHILTQIALAQSIGETRLAAQLSAQLGRSPYDQLLQQHLGQPQVSTTSAYHDIAVLIRAHTALEQQQYAALQPLLNCLNHWPEHPQQDLLSTALRQAYVQHLYAKWAVMQPWQVLTSTVFEPHFQTEHWHSWLNALYQQVHQANDVAWQVLLEYFDQQTPELKQTLAGSWLRLWTEYQTANARAVQLGVETLRQQFCPTILYDWLRSARSLIDLEPIAILLTELQARYVGQPALQLAQAYWCAVQGHHAEAEQWVSAWPNTVLRHRLQALLSLDQLARPSRLAAPLFVFDIIEAER